jgi:hypothetical protein
MQRVYRINSKIMDNLYKPKKIGKTNINTYFKEVQMNQGGLKNMVVLKNLPSNIVEEAIIVLKTNKKIKQVEKIEKEKMTENKYTKTREDDYILKEAEMLVNTYISKLEDKKKTREITNKKEKQKYNRIKNYAYISSFVILIESIILFIR